MKLYFQPSEFRVTETGLPNYVEDDLVNFHLTRLSYTLNVLRGLIGRPIKILSGYRSIEVNEAVGGSKLSYHLFGRAADITCDKLHDLLELCHKLKESQVFIEVIYYPERNFIHVAI